MKHIYKAIDEASFIRTFTELKLSKFSYVENIEKTHRSIIITLKTKSRKLLIEQLDFVKSKTPKESITQGICFDESDQRKNQIIVWKHKSRLELSKHYENTGLTYNQWVEYAKGYRYGKTPLNSNILSTNVGTMYMYIN